MNLSQPVEVTDAGIAEYDLTRCPSAGACFR
jgi:hypothetical protein